MANLLCTVDGCEREQHARKMCHKHYNRWHRENRAPQPPCSIEGCDRERWARGYCSTHYQRWWQTGGTERRLLRAPAGSGYTTSKGYRQVYVDGKKRWEHRVVMAQTLGRDLLPGESVHHKNGDRTDNRPENLELLVSHPYGQRIADALDWAREIIERYDGMLFIP